MCNDFIYLHFKIVMPPPSNNSMHQRLNELPKVSFMIDTCFNPSCRRQLHYLRDGRVVFVTRGKEADVSIEHYWLCGPCYEDHDFVFSPDGAVSLDVRSHEEHGIVAFRNVVLPERRSLKRASDFAKRGEAMPFVQPAYPKSLLSMFVGTGPSLPCLSNTEQGEPSEAPADERAGNR